MSGDWERRIAPSSAINALHLRGGENFHGRRKAVSCQSSVVSLQLSCSSFYLLSLADEAGFGKLFVAESSD